MNNKEFYCPLFDGAVTQYDCDELSFGANFRHLINDGLPHLMSIEDIIKKRTICVKCQVNKNKLFSSDPEILKRIEELEELYKDDDEALEVIERSKTEFTYLERKALEGNYKGQTPKQYLMSLERHLHDWH